MAELQVSKPGVEVTLSRMSSALFISLFLINKNRHGRDHKFRVWEINYNEFNLSTTLPVDGASEDQPKPWLLHSMDMSALNFCAFATCVDPSTGSTTNNADNELLVASPNGLDDGGIDIFQLPSQSRVSQLASAKTGKTGMVMSIALFYSNETSSLHMISGYEDGQVMVHAHQGALGLPGGKWVKVMSSKAHSQPVLSIDLSPKNEYFITSSADATIAKFEMPVGLSITNTSTSPLKTVNTKHAGQQGLTIRSDGKIFATAGWDARVRVYSAKTLKELAVLKWHKGGCYSTAFAEVRSNDVSGRHVKVDTPLLDVTNKTALYVIKYERNMKAQQMHWLAAGGKDGKISLWDIY